MPHTMSTEADMVGDIAHNLKGYTMDKETLRKSARERARQAEVHCREVAEVLKRVGPHHTLSLAVLGACQIDLQKALGLITTAKALEEACVLGD